MATLSSGGSLRLREEVVEAGGEYFEAPVLGSRPQAREGKLLVMVGATPTQFDRWSELLGCFGPEPRLVGPVGRAAALKLAFNQLIAAQLTGFATALGLIRHAGIDVELFMELLRRSALHAPSFDAKLPRLLERNFSDANFPLRLLLKDLGLARDLATDYGLETAALDGLCRVAALGVDGGRADADYSAVSEVIDPR